MGSTVIRFIKRYFLTVLAIGLLMLPIYFKAFTLLEQNEEASISREIENGMDILNNEITSINNVIMEIPSNQHFSYVRYLDEISETGDYYVLMSLRDDLSDLTGGFSFAVEPMVYFPNGMIFCRKTVYSSEAQDSYMTFRAEKNGKLESWFQKLSMENRYYSFLPADIFHSVNNDTFTGLPYISSYGWKEQSPQAFFITYLPMDTLYELWGLNYLKDIASVTIYDSETEEVLYTNGVEVSGSSSQFFCDSKGSNLLLRVEVPKNVFWEKLSGLVTLASAYLIIFLGLTIVGAVVLAYENMKPLRKIKLIIDQYTQDGSDQKKDVNYEYIAQAISEIGDEAMEYKSKHKRLDEELAHWTLREQILNGLDDTQFEKLEEIYSGLERPFRLMIIHMTQTEWEYASAEV